jgi:nitronate monooxygenase
MARSAARHGLLGKLGLRVPIIQAPMAGVSTPEMAAAVSSAGGLGSIGVGASDAAGARAMIRATRERGSGPVHVNVFCHAVPIADAAREAAWLERLRPEFARFGQEPPAALREIYRSFTADPEMQEVLLAERPEVLSFHFGLPGRDVIQRLHDSGVTLLGSATCLREGAMLEAAGLDGVIAQGYEAGGHRGIFDQDRPDDRLGAMALTRVLVRRLEIPVIAAGGIMDGAGIAAVLELGACAASLGTAFVLADESAADVGHRAALQSEAAYHTVMTRAISGRLARCLPNRFTRLGAEAAEAEVPAYPIAYDAAKILHALARTAGEFGYGAQWAGQGAPLCRTGAAAAILQALAADLDACRGEARVMG